MLDFAIQELKDASSTQSCEDTRFVHLDQAIEILVASHGEKLSDYQSKKERPICAKWGNCGSTDCLTVSCSNCDDYEPSEG